jgi:hypothetical protein
MIYYIKVKKMQKEIERIRGEVSDFCYGFDDFFEDRYAILLKEGKVDFVQLPSASENFWNEEGFSEIGYVQGLGLDGIKIHLELDGEKYDDQGFFDLPDPVDQ